MDKLDKRKIGIGVAIVLGVVLVFFVGKEVMKWRAGKQNQAQTEKARKQAEAETRQVVLFLRQTCRYADSVGIDTTRFAAKPNTDKAGAEAQLISLLMEIRYGKKPSRLAYSGLKESVDSAWATTVNPQETGLVLPKKIGATVAPFGPYNQLVGHYNRLRKQEKTNPATADTLRLIRQTLNFYRYVNRFDADRFVMVNIPAGELNVFDRSGKRLLPMQVIAGKPDKRTPCMTTYIKDIVAYPYWNVPRNIALE